MNNVGRTASKNWLSLVLIFLFTFSISFAGGRFVRSILVGNNSAQNNSSENNNPEDNAFGQDSASRDSLRELDLQPIVDSWISTIDNKSKVGVAIYDLDRDEMVARYNENQVFLTDNLRNLILAYDGYRQLDSGTETADTNVINAMTYGECLDNMLRTNDTICSDAILFDQERSARVETFLSELGLAKTTAFGQSSTASDFAKILQRIWKHSDLTLESWAKFQDSMLEISPENAADWRLGLPSGFSTAKVYAKASGSSDTGKWVTYSDLALVDFVKTNRHLAIVVLSQNLGDVSDLSRLGTLIEGKVIEE